MRFIPRPGLTRCEAFPARRQVGLWRCLDGKANRGNGQPVSAAEVPICTELQQLKKTRHRPGLFLDISVGVSCHWLKQSRDWPVPPR
jgi:hypothetical protein